MTDCSVHSSITDKKKAGKLKDHCYYVYILASKREGTLYTGVTNDLKKRSYEHKEELIEGFTRKYHVHKLVYYERFRDVHSAILREKRIKKWNRVWKIRLIEEKNPEWNDLSEQSDE